VQRETERINAEPKLATAAASTGDAIAGAILVLVVGSYAALDPQTYIAGLLRILPEKRRERARRVGAQVLYTLRWWLLGQLEPMAFLGVLTMLGLWLLHVPLAFTLGLLTAVMIFIPYLGALASEIPAVLVALQQGPRTMLYVLILYLGVHSLEAYLITPLIQKQDHTIAAHHYRACRISDVDRGGTARRHHRDTMSRGDPNLNQNLISARIARKALNSSRHRNILRARRSWRRIL